MSALSEDMRRLVDQQRLGFWATVNEDGSPNLSPKGTTLVWDDDHLFFADIRSPDTVANIRRGSIVEVNVVDPLARRGYRFKGRASVHDPRSAAFEEGLARLRTEGSRLVDRVRAIVLLEVREAKPITSPAYDTGADEAGLISAFRARFDELHPP